MKAEATFKYLRISPKKIRELAQTIVGLNTNDAIDRMSIGYEKSARFLSLAIKSVMSNAINNMKMDPQTLRIKTVEILKGPHFKRFQPVSRGMVHQIKKRTTHLRIVLEDVKLPNNASSKKAKFEVKSEDPKIKEVKKEIKADLKTKTERKNRGTKS